MTSVMHRSRPSIIKLGSGDHHDPAVMSKRSYSEVYQWFLMVHDAAKDRSSVLSDWDRNFVLSLLPLHEQWEKSGRDMNAWLSGRQRVVLFHIHRKLARIVEKEMGDAG